MVTGFEEYTSELTPFEQEKIYPKFIAAWKCRQNNELITMKQMLAGMNSWCEKQNFRRKNGKLFKLTEPRLRKVIHQARVSGDLSKMIANSKGYFKTDDQDKIKDFIKSCRERANSFKEVADSLETYNFER